MEIVFATENVHKLAELRAFFKEGDSGVDLLSLHSFPSFKLIDDEIGRSSEEKASEKALFAAKSLDRIALADTSILVVPALEGSAEVISSCYVGQSHGEKEARQRLLKQMEKLVGIERSAYLECCLVLASPEGVMATAKASVEGIIGEAEKGGNGFGFDPLFIKHDSNKTFAQLDPQVKNKISHRRKAFDKLLMTLERLNLVRR